MDLPTSLRQNRAETDHGTAAWDTAAVHDLLVEQGASHTLRTTERQLETADWLPGLVKLADVRDEHDRPLVKLVSDSMEAEAKRKRSPVLVLQRHRGSDAAPVLFSNDGRSGRRWVFIDELSEDPDTVLMALDVLVGRRAVTVWPHGEITAVCRRIVERAKNVAISLPSGGSVTFALPAYRPVLPARPSATEAPAGQLAGAGALSHLDRLEAESIHIMREVAAQADHPVMLYSVGKDSSVMLHLAKKAFYPSPPPFPLMHVDTRWKFQAMYDFRDAMAEDSGMELIVHINPEGVEKNINPFDHGSAIHTDVMKTQGLKQALDQHGFDVAFGGARRDEEKSRAKERVFSFRTETHRWDPKNQRPELWNLYNGYKKNGESIRVFPLSNWTELDIWQYIYREQIPIVPLYFAAERPVVERDGMLMMVDDDRMRLHENEAITLRRVRFRTLGCYPLTGAIESDADDLSSIVLELLQSRTSERQGRTIDTDTSASMEKKKQEGYF